MSLEGSSLLEMPNRRDNVGVYFGIELCLVINSSLFGSLILLIGHVKPRFRYV